MILHVVRAGVWTHGNLMVDDVIVPFFVVSAHPLHNLPIHILIDFHLHIQIHVEIRTLTLTLALTLHTLTLTLPHRVGLALVLG